MGVKYNREYQVIVEEIAAGIQRIEDCYDFFEMSCEEWSQLVEEEQTECALTLADDIFYGLGSLPLMDVGSGKIEYDAVNHLIKITSSSKILHIVHLV